MTELPATFKKLEVHKLSTDFRKATRTIECKLSKPKPGMIVIKVFFAGVNASDINFSAGRYLKDAKPPFDVGAECVGRIVALAPDVKKFKVGDPVASVGWPGM